jgi:hypothetical protein
MKIKGIEINVIYLFYEFVNFGKSIKKELSHLKMFIDLQWVEMTIHDHDDQPTCQICLDNIERSVTLICGHPFHFECLEKFVG